MASFKALCLVGVASLIATASAHAADLPLPALPAAPLYAPAASALTGNFYLRGDVGVGVADLRMRESSFDAGYNPVANGIAYNGHSLGDEGVIDIGVGYRFNEYFRADVTADYHASSSFSAIESYSATTPSGRQYDNYSGSFRSIVGLINGYVDMGTYWCMTPFFGLGVGVANIGVNNITDSSGNGGFGFAADHNQTNFAYALMAGIDFSVTQNLKLEIGYRYLDMGNASSGAIVCQNTTFCAHEVQRSHLASNDVRLGFRYSFADYAPARPVMARY